MWFGQDFIKFCLIKGIHQISSPPQTNDSTLPAVRMKGCRQNDSSWGHSWCGSQTEGAVICTIDYMYMYLISVWNCYLYITDNKDENTMRSSVFLFYLHV